MKNIFLFLQVLIAVFTLSFCNKEKADHRKFSDPKQQFAHAFFSNLPDNDSRGNGLWVADKTDFQKYIHNRYLKNYKPEPNENSSKIVEELLNDSNLFFRIEAPSIGQLFLVRNYNMTLSAGEIKLDRIEGNKEIYALLLHKRKADGEKYYERSMLHLNLQDNVWYYITEGHAIRLVRETRDSSELINTYVEGLTSSLKEY